MDKVFSGRLGHEALHKLELISKKMDFSKKQVLEEAITLYWNSIGANANHSVMNETSGTWNRKEPIEATHKNSKLAFTKSMKRHHL